MAAGNLRVEIEKARRELRLYDGETLVKTYRVALGLNPVPPKRRAGDRATPEGTYFICLKNPASRFTLSLAINYPNARDAERGLKEGLIGRAARDRIVAAERRRTVPPWNTALGGEIFIHGRGAGSDWTWGCVALDDDDVRELYARLPVGTPVEIRP
ncbi:MAG TPA: L,D-transpeptidase [Thermoanaerobaculia bacterium]|nr:L,D-transpeptidase [Thermoanaerobaculia bacterium]